MKPFWLILYFFKRIFTNNLPKIWYRNYLENEYLRMPWMVNWKPMHWDGMWVVILENNNIDSDIISNFLTLFYFYISTKIMFFY